MSIKNQTKNNTINEIKNNNISENIDIKTIVIPTLLMVITFMILIVGATYAYFSVKSTSNSASSTVTTKSESVGISTLKAGENNLSLKLTLSDMMQGENDITYYATSTGTPSVSEVNEVIGTSEVEGNGVMNCSYELAVNLSGTMYTTFQSMSTKSTGQLVLNINGTDYDLYNETFPLTINGTLENVKDGSPKDIIASFRIVNKKDADQSKLAGTDIVFSFSVNDYKCQIVG